jgi:Cyclin, N-terminal domain
MHKSTKLYTYIQVPPQISRTSRLRSLLDVLRAGPPFGLHRRRSAGPQNWAHLNDLLLSKRKIGKSKKTLTTRGVSLSCHYYRGKKRNTLAHQGILLTCIWEYIYCINIMLKLTMCPRKRSKKQRAIPFKLRIPLSTSNLICEHDVTIQQEMFADNLQSMLKQERSGVYQCSDYLSMATWQDRSSYQVIKKPKFEVVSRNNGATSPSLSNSMIDEYCREQIVEWSFRVVDYFRIDREVVAVSLSFLDRFLSTCRCDRTSFKLAATTTLHLAVKLLYPCKLSDLGILSDLSRGEFDMKDVCAMEYQILLKLSWNLHPPTAIAFSSIFLDYFFASRVVTISGADLVDIYDVTSFFCELAVCDYMFALIPVSTIALAALLNSLEGMYGSDNRLSIDVIQASHEIHLGIPQNLATARNRLWELYERSEECAMHNEKNMDEEPATSWHHGSIFVKKPTALSSPVSVTKPCHSAADFGYSGKELRIRNESW